MSPAVPAAATGGSVRRERDVAKRAVARAWHSTGWSQHPSRGVDYGPLHHCLCRYVEVTYKSIVSLTTETVVEIVDAALCAYMAPLHAGKVSVALLSHQGLLGETDDQALRRTATADQDPVDTEHPFGVTRGNIANDMVLTEKLFGATPNAVRSALRQAFQEGNWIEYLVITQYLNAGFDVASSDLVANITRNLSRQHLLAGSAIGTDLVHSAINQFNDRLRSSVQ